jgi:pyridoxamine 5'-phosphate oxidase family protein
MSSTFTPEEVAYLQSQRLGRLATIDEQGDLHVVPVSFRYNSEQDTIDIGGHNIAGTKKYHDAIHHGRAAFVVDDVLPPWRPRMVEIRGAVQGLSTGGQEIMESFAPEILRITPTYIVSLGLVDQGDEPRPARTGRIRGRRVESSK